MESVMTLILILFVVSALISILAIFFAGHPRNRGRHSDNGSDGGIWPAIFGDSTSSDSGNHHHHSHHGHHHHHHDGGGSHHGGFDGGGHHGGFDGGGGGGHSSGHH